MTNQMEVVEETKYLATKKANDRRRGVNGKALDHSVIRACLALMSHLQCFILISYLSSQNVRVTKRKHKNHVKVTSP